MKIENLFESVGNGGGLEDVVFVLRGDLGDHDQQIDELNRRSAFRKFDLSFNFLQNQLQIFQIVVRDQQVRFFDGLVVGFRIRLATIDRLNVNSSLSQNHDQKTPIFQSLVALDSAEASDWLHRSHVSQPLPVLPQYSAEDQLTTAVEKVTGHLPVAGFEHVQGNHLTREKDQVGEGEQGARPRVVARG